ncbi:ATP-binding protein [Geminicoccaceae bacterium 1502E]|nr:ATP-binding protein [Geminicoccaceae bacterium 1502E]
MPDTPLMPLLERIASALERLAPPPAPAADLHAADAFVWEAAGERLRPVKRVAGIDLGLLCGIDRVAGILLDNTRRFAQGLPANNALLWGARGMGKSSLVKAVHGHLNAGQPGALVLIEIHREDIDSLPKLLAMLASSGRRCLLFCDDLSFDAGETSYKSLKAVLEGGVEGRPGNVLFYATSNRRHLMPRQMIENERSTAINPSESIEEKVSLSDRFGLWLGFHPCDQETYLAMIDGYVRHYGLEVEPEALRREALEWAQTRGGRSGRVAWQFIQDLAGRRGVDLEARAA